jgi:hypothetical protein
VKQIGDKELENVLSLPGPDRYEYLVKWVAEEERAWGLWQDGWAMMADSQGEMSVPFWPYERFAVACREGDFSTYEPRAIELAELRGLIERLENDGIGLAVFPAPSGSAPVIRPSQFIRDVDSYIAEWF